MASIAESLGDRHYAIDVDIDILKIESSEMVRAFKWSGTCIFAFFLELTFFLIFLSPSDFATDTFSIKHF